MALAISSVPVLTGDVAERFESEAQKTYEKYINRTEIDKKSAEDRYKHAQELVRQILAKSKIGQR